MSSPDLSLRKWKPGLGGGLLNDAAVGLGLVHRCRWFIWLLPGVTVAVVLLSLRSPWHSLFRKDFQEVFAPTVLGLAMLVSMVLGARFKLPFLKWQACLTTALFCRELHFVGTNNGIYVALLVLFWYLARHAQRMEPFLQSRLVASSLCGTLWAYAWAKTFDRGYWRELFPAIEPLRDAFEESLESTGHLLILSLVCVSWAVTSKNLGQNLPADIPKSKFRRGPYVIVAALGIALGLFAAMRWHTGSSPGRVVASFTANLHLQHLQPEQNPDGLPFELSALCRVYSERGQNRFLAGSDEHRDLWLCAADESGHIRSLSKLELKIPADDGETYQLDDLEGLAGDGKGRYYAVTSHRQLRAAKDRRRFEASRGTECALISFELEKKAEGFRVTNARTVCRDLLDRIRKLHVFETVNWQHPKTFRWHALTTTWQIDIEGLACVGGKILLGFKNPVEEARATILSFDVETQKLEIAARPELNGQGILALDYDRIRDRLLVLTNDPVKGRYGKSCLWIATRGPTNCDTWRFQNQPHAVLENGRQHHRKASGVVLGKDHIFVCFDDADRPVMRLFPLQSIDHN